MILQLRILLFVALAGILTACGGYSEFEPVELNMSLINILWKQINIREKYVVRNDREWEIVWQKHGLLTSQKEDRPSIDFSEKMVLGLSFGTAPNGCYGLKIHRVVEEEEEIRVEYYYLTERADSFCLQATMALTEFVVVKKIEKKVIFVNLYRMDDFKPPLTLVR